MLCTLAVMKTVKHESESRVMVESTEQGDFPTATCNERRNVDSVAATWDS